MNANRRTLCYLDKNTENIVKLNNLRGLPNVEKEPDKKEDGLFEVKHPLDRGKSLIGYRIHPDIIEIWLERKVS